MPLNTDDGRQGVMPCFRCLASGIEPTTGATVIDPCRQCAGRGHVHWTQMPGADRMDHSTPEGTKP